MNFALQIMALEMDSLEIFMFVFGFIYLVFLAVIGDKYGKKLSKIKGYKLKVFWNKMNESEFSLKESWIKKEIRQLKVIAYITILIIGIIHIGIVYYQDQKIVFPLGLMLIFEVFLVILFWLKGNSVYDKNKRFRGMPGGI
jgi:Na+/proline symporter